MTTLSDLINDYTTDIIEITQEEDYDAIDSRPIIVDLQNSLMEDIKNLLLKIVL